jgi:hypothetical protein
MLSERPVWVSDESKMAWFIIFLKEAYDEVLFVFEIYSI